MNTGNEKPMLEIKSEDDTYIHWKDALRMKEFYILWITRLSVVLITQVCKISNIKSSTCYSHLSNKRGAHAYQFQKIPSSTKQKSTLLVY